MQRRGHLAIMPAEAQSFEATLYPNQPTSRAGFIGVMLGMSSISLVMAVGFALVGAWPVAGFLGLDWLLLYWAFRIVRDRALRREQSASTAPASWCGGWRRTAPPANGASSLIGSAS